MNTTTPPETFPPTLREVMFRPRWLALLGACLVVAGIFAWLGQWQLGRAVRDISHTAPETETVQPLDAVAQPGHYLPADAPGQKVSVSGSFVADDFLVVAQRDNLNNTGFWVTGQLRLSDTDIPTSVAVDLGWAATLQQADTVAATLVANPPQNVTITGRLIADEQPLIPSGSDPEELLSVSSAQMLSRWHDTTSLEVYRASVISDNAPDGLVTIDAPPPQQSGGLNWLNLFYAAEWALFAGFAFYFWYRVAKDAWERECEELEEPTNTETSRMSS